MATHGHVGEFNSDSENWTLYCERLEQYYTANEITDATKQRAIFLSVCGAATYQLIRSLVAPKMPTDSSFAELVKLVADHNTPLPSEIVQRFNFNTRSQKDGEKVAAFVANLRQLSEHCAYGDTLEDMLRDRIVCGIRDTRLQRRLLAETALTFKKAFELAQASELADKKCEGITETLFYWGSRAVSTTEASRTHPPRTASLLPLWRKASLQGLSVQERRLP